MQRPLPDGGYALSGLQNLFHRGNVPHRLPDGAYRLSGLQGSDCYSGYASQMQHSKPLFN